MCHLFPEFRSRFVTDLCLDFSCNLWQLHEDILEQPVPPGSNSILGKLTDEENSLRRQTSLKKKIKRISQIKSEKNSKTSDLEDETDFIDESNQLIDQGKLLGHFLRL